MPYLSNRRPILALSFQLTPYPSFQGGGAAWAAVGTASHVRRTSHQVPPPVGQDLSPGTKSGTGTAYSPAVFPTVGPHALPVPDFLPGLRSGHVRRTSQVPPPVGQGLSEMNPLSRRFREIRAVHLVRLSILLRERPHQVPPPVGRDLSPGTKSGTGSA